jgi:hypothetical protein
MWTLWRCDVGLFFEVPPLASDAPFTTLHPLLENVLQTVDHFEISCLGAPFSWLEKPRNRMGRDLNRILCSAWKKWISGTPLEHPSYSPDLVRIQRAEILKIVCTWILTCRIFTRSTSETCGRFTQQPSSLETHTEAKQDRKVLSG